MNSGTDGGNSDIGVLADFSDNEEESEVEQFSGCRIPGCQCGGVSNIWNAALTI